MILLYLEGSGSKFHSVNAKTSQSCPFFGVQELGIEHVNTKTNQFSPFFGFQELRKNVNTKTSQFSQFFGFQELRTNMSTPKLVNFHQFSTFFEFQELSKNMCIYIYNMYICTSVYYMILLYLEGSGSKFHSVNAKTSQSCPFFGVQELGIEHVNTKTNQFSPFFGFQELRKNANTKTSQFSPCFGFQELRTNMSTPKLVNFPHFLNSRSWAKTCAYIYMYICTSVYYMILLYLEGSGSKFQSVSTKTSQFSQFFGFQELRKNMSTPKLVNFPHVLDSRSLRKNISTPNLVKFPHFWIPGVEEKTCQHQN